MSERVNERPHNTQRVTHVPVSHEVGGLSLSRNSLTGKKKRLNKPKGDKKKKEEKRGGERKEILIV